MERSGRRQKLLTMLLLAALALFLLAGMKPMVPDGDNFWQAATGRYIVNHGLPKENPFVFSDGLGIVVQQWLFDIVVYFLYELFGAGGLLALGCAVFCGLCAALYAYCSQFTQNRGARAAVSVVAAVILARKMSMTRPMALTVILLLLFACELERDRRRPGWHIAVVMAGLSLVLINLQAALWPAMFLVTAPYLMFDRVPWRSFRVWFSGWFSRRKFLLLGVLAALPASLVNPYGLDGVLYLFRSYGAASVSGIVQEMKPPVLLSDTGLLLVLAVILGTVWFCENRRRPDVRLVLFALGGCLATGMNSRNFWLLLFCAIPEIMYFVNDANRSPADELARLGRRDFAFAAGLCAVVILVSAFMIAGNEYADRVDGYYTPIAAADYLDNESDVRVYADFNSGGYMEWRGYQVYIDARPELYSEPVNGREDVLSEWMGVEYNLGEPDYEAFLAKYGFTHLILHEDSSLRLYVDTAGGWMRVLTGGESGESGGKYYLYERSGL